MHQNIIPDLKLELSRESFTRSLRNRPSAESLICFQDPTLPIAGTGRWLPLANQATYAHCLLVLQLSYIHISWRAQDGSKKMQSKASSGEQLDYTSDHGPLSTTMLQRVSVHSGLSMPVQPLCRHRQHKTKKPSSPSALEAEGMQCKEVVLGSGYHAEP